MKKLVLAAAVVVGFVACNVPVAEEDGGTGGGAAGGGTTGGGTTGGGTSGGGTGGGTTGGGTGGGSAGGGGATGGGTGGGSTTGGGTGGGATGGGTGGGTTGGGGATGGGTGLVPNVMLLVDLSGSMNLPINPSDAACPSGCGVSSANPCPITCPTRLSELRSGLTTFLSTRGTTARFGLTTYPAGPLCQVPTAVTIDLPPAMAADIGNETFRAQHAATISTAISAVTAQGGTPTAASLGFVGGLSGLQQSDGRADVVVLITDGLPNCNTTNPNALCGCQASNSCSAAQTSACACTTSSCTSALCSLGCLDASAATTAVSTLHASGIDVVVVGFGADTATGAASVVLDSMARVGGRPHACPGGTSGECGGGTCGADHICADAFFRASDGAALFTALDTAL